MFTKKPAKGNVRGENVFRRRHYLRLGSTLKLGSGVRRESCPQRIAAAPIESSCPSTFSPTWETSTLSELEHDMVKKIEISAILLAEKYVWVLHHSAANRARKKN
jgi:hypothetical protein